MSFSRFLNWLPVIDTHFESFYYQRSPISREINQEDDVSSPIICFTSSHWRYSCYTHVSSTKFLALIRNFSIYSVCREDVPDVPPHAGVTRLIQNQTATDGRLFWMVSTILMKMTLFFDGNPVFQLVHSTRDSSFIHIRCMYTHIKPRRSAISAENFFSDL